MSYTLTGMSVRIVQIFIIHEEINIAGIVVFNFNGLKEVTNEKENSS
jgi:hypothetical protein